jgi:glyoxylase-like metal-dependent hydrolase (beta-lactamase superfamily II)/rhodanese-related sulfurtransferase
MYIRQLYTNCLAQAAYYIESEKEAAVIDPLRDPEPYLALAAERGAKIKYVLETHFHADFVSGHLDLANKTGALIVFGPDATPDYRALIATDGEQLSLGKMKIEVLHTPGHTVESACYLLYDEEGNKHAVFTGDTLFAGDVGRPDLMSGNLAKETLAAMLFRSLRDKIKTLTDDIIVYPGHGAGSACGKNIGTSSFSTIGEERRSNYAMRIEDEQEFITAVTTDLPYIPGYFFVDAQLNKSGAGPVDSVVSASLCPLSAEVFTDMHNAGATLLDTRDPMDFAAGFIPGAINIGLNGDFAVWAGTLIPPTSRILLVCDPGKETEAVQRLARIGYEKVQGYLNGGMQTWFAANERHDRIMTLRGDECKTLTDTEGYKLLDVRNRRETARQRLTGSLHIPLTLLKDRIDNLKRDDKWLIYCAGGYRSMIAASLLKAAGFHFVASIEGGIKDVAHMSPQLVEIGEEA